MEISKDCMFKESTQKNTTTTTTTTARITNKEQK